uniref:Lipocalin n=1 Tax=Rhipicephalus zambeziensis TaxID=60191 RepID=A0A224YMV8_9ACAR
MNVVTIGVLAVLSLLVLPHLIVCPLHKVNFNDLLLFLNTSFRIYIFTLRENLNEPCPYYVKEFLNETYYVFNFTTEEGCKPNTTKFNADLGNTTENTPYMNIHGWKGSNLTKELRYYNDGEKCAIFSFWESRQTHYELHVWSIKFSISNGRKVFLTCFNVYSAYTAQLSHLRYECNHGC